MKLFCVKNKQNEFIVHPNAFNSGNNININLKNEEFQYLMAKMIKNINNDIIENLNEEIL